MREHVARIRQLMLEAAPLEVFNEAERRAKRDFEYYDLNLERIPRIDGSNRSRTIRRVLRIVNSYGWHAALATLLDHHNVESLDELNDIDLAAIDQRMQQLEECIQHGLGAPDAPPAT